MRDLSRLFAPQSIAVFGSNWAQNVIEQCVAMGFGGQVWPIHPTRAEIGGQRCYASLDALPHAPDAAFVGVNRHATIEIVQQLSKMGAGGAVCFASGWRETGDADLQRDLVRAAGDMPILGPNCYGVINYLDGALLWPDEHGGRRVDSGVALISQSSNIVINLTMQARGLPVAYVACLGNAAQTGLAELSAALLADERVTALGLYVEGFDDAPAFAQLAQAARAAGKPIVALKSGKTDAAQQAAASHTAALAGGGAASSAFLRQTGVAEVTTLPELVEALKIAHVHGVALRDSLGLRLCSLSCSGGEAGLMADLGHMAGVEFPPPNQTQIKELSALLGPLVTISNPLDYHTFIWGDFDKTRAVFSTMLADYDAGLFVIDPPRADRCNPNSFEPALDAIEAAQADTGKIAFPVSSLPENFDEARAIEMMARGVVPLMGLETSLGALKALQTPSGQAGWSPWVARARDDETLIDEATAKAELSRAGILTPRGVQAATLEALDHSALSPPFALKGLGFAHKSEAGAVRLNVVDPRDTAPMPGASGYLLEEMVQDGVAELLLGVQRDPVYGVTLTLGLGGVAAELLDDTVTLIAPVTAEDIRDVLGTLKLWPLLTGWRGGAVADTQSAIAVTLRLQDMMKSQSDLNEIEINPLILRENGAIAVDAVIWRQH